SAVCFEKNSGNLRRRLWSNYGWKLRSLCSRMATTASRKSSARRVLEIASSCDGPFSEHLASRPKPFDALHSFSRPPDIAMSEPSMRVDGMNVPVRTTERHGREFRIVRPQTLALQAEVHLPFLAAIAHGTAGNSRGRSGVGPVEGRPSP